MVIFIANSQRTRKIRTHLLKRVAGALLADLKIADAELGINLVSRKEMARVNEQFLRHAGSTDVVAFNYAEAETSRPGARASRPRVSKTGTRGRATRAPIHGEIFICVSEAVAQCKKFDTNWQSEMVRYLVHGILHLLGHDDHRPTARRRMKREEDRRLCTLAGKFSLAELSRP